MNDFYFKGSDIEEVTDDMLEKMIIKEDKLAVLFYEENEENSNIAVELLEDIDDDLDEMGVLMVKINEPSVATDFGIESRPTLVVFEKGIPNLFEGIFSKIKSFKNCRISSYKFHILILVDSFLKTVYYIHTFL